MNELDQRLEETGAEIRANAAMLPDRQRRRPERRGGGRRAAVAVAVVVLGAVFIAAPALWLDMTSGGDSDVGAGQGTAVEISFGEPVTVTTPPGELRAMLTVGDVLYVAAVGPTDRVVRSTDHGSTWETVLEADPGDGEGLFAAGEVVVLVVEDDNPARDTAEPSSVVSEAPRVLVFDPATEETFEAVLPRPEDPVMEGLPEDEIPGGCGTFGYQSWIGAHAVAVGDRIVVTGSQWLVGRLDDGSVLCDGQAFRYLTWTSDDRGRTWELHDGRSLQAVTWTGTRFVGWSTSQTVTPGGPAVEIVVSTDGVDWTTGVSSPDLPEGTITVDRSVLSAGDTVIAWTSIHEWATQVPENVTDPEQLRDVLRVSDEFEVEQTLEMLGIDLPLDSAERKVIARFNASTEPKGAVVAISSDGGLSWAATYVSEPLTGIVGEFGFTFVALATSSGDPADPTDYSSALLTSSDGINWIHAVDLPSAGYGPGTFAATGDAIYANLRDDQGGKLWRIPVNP